MIPAGRLVQPLGPLPAYNPSAQSPWLKTGSERSAKTLKAEAEILAILADGDQLTRRQIASRLTVRLNNNTMGTILQRMKFEGRIRRTCLGSRWMRK